MNLPIEFVNHLYLGYCLREHDKDYEPLLRIVHQYLNTSYVSELYRLYGIVGGEKQMAYDLFEWFADNERERLKSEEKGEEKSYLVFYQPVSLTFDFKTLFKPTEEK